MEEHLRKMIASGAYPAGMKLPSDQDLSRDFGVAYMTIRHAMEPLAREGLVVRRRGKGTFVADSPDPSPAVRTLALVIPSISTMWNVADVYYLPGIVQAFCAEATRLGYEPAVVGGATSLRAGQFTVGAGICAGVALLLARESDFAAVDEIAATQVPLVTIHTYRGRRTITMVQVKQAEGVAAVVAHLAGLGHQRIAYLGGPEHNLAAAARHDGFRAGMRHAGLPVRYHGAEAGEYTDGSGQIRAAKLLDGINRPTAIATASDLIAAGAIRAAQERNFRVPEDLSVTGFGDFYIAQMLRPSLTTARLPLAEMGGSAARALDRVIAGEPRGKLFTLETQLTVRRSTAAPPKG